MTDVDIVGSSMTVIGIAMAYYAAWRGFKAGFAAGVQRMQYQNREPPHCPTCDCDMPEPYTPPPDACPAPIDGKTTAAECVAAGQCGCNPDPEANRVLYENLERLQRR